MRNDQDIILDFEKILSRIKSILGVEKDKEVASAINMKANAFYNRKKSGSVPLSEFVCLAAHYNISMDWLIFGVGPKNNFDIRNQFFLANFKDPDLGLQNIERLIGIERASDELNKKVTDYLKITYDTIKTLENDQRKKIS